MSALSSLSRETILRYFDRRVRRYGHSHASLGWTSPQSQRARFGVLAEIGALDGRTVLDVGCGLGDLYGFLRKRVTRFEYLGLDMSTEMVERAAKLYPGAGFRLAEFPDCDGEAEFDYVFASGIYNLATGDNEVVMRRIIRRMFDLCRIGAGVAMTGGSDLPRRWFPSPRGSVYYYRSEEMVEFCGALAPRVELREGYVDDDFALFLYRDAL